mgnify:CR=1 FL=1
MTVDDVEAKLVQIEQVLDDTEAAHCLEDDLHVEVLRAIGEGADNAQDLAKSALKTLELIKNRWYA